jgi:hypothetical protein
MRSLTDGRLCKIDHLGPALFKLIERIQRAPPSGHATAPPSAAMKVRRFVYWEFAAQNRSSGWNTWLAFSIAPTEKVPKIAK